MADLQNRTLICSVLFIDIVEYSRKPVVEQIQLKDRFNALLSDALRGVAVNDRIILDTGDGAAISFIGDPEDALFVGSGLRDEIAAYSEDAQVELTIRMGINLGPVRLVKDINGQPNIIGDGINVAQRVMSFAKPGQVLVSRSYYEVVSRLSDESSKLFSYEGSRTDKHIREHEVYAVGAIPALHRRIDDTPSPRWTVAADAGRTPGFRRVTRTAKDVAHQVVTKPRLATAIAVTGIIVTAFGARAWRDPPDRADRPLLAAAESTGVTRTVSSESSAPAVQKPVPAHIVPPPTQPPLVAIPRSFQPAPVVSLPDSTPPQVKRVDAVRNTTLALAETRATGAGEEKSLPQAAEAQLAVLSLAIAPWGQIYVDGRSRGVSPPLQELELSPGKHRVELTNTGSEPHVVTVNVKPGQRLRIKHKFK
jgi:class 3 adenylate cyclase